MICTPLVLLRKRRLHFGKVMHKTVQLDLNRDKRNDFEAFIFLFSARLRELAANFRLTLSGEKGFYSGKQGLREGLPSSAALRGAVGENS